MTGKEEKIQHSSSYFNLCQTMDSNTPLISVITIVKDNEELLLRAVESVLNQTFTEFEHIIVNDGSTDGTRAIIDQYADKDKRVLPKHLLQNVGRAMARNAGMAASKGRYIFFLDSDDYLPETALMDLYEVAEKKSADIVYGCIKSFDQITGNWRPQYYTDLIIKSERHNFRLDDHLVLVDNHQLVGRLYRNEFLLKNDIKFSTTRRNAEDILFSFFSAFHAGNLSMVPQKTIYFYNFGNQLETVSEAKLLDARDNILESIDFTSKFGSSSLKKRMRQKGVIFAGNLYRAQKFYDGDEVEFRTYMTTLVPLVNGISADELAELPLEYLNLPENELADLQLYFQSFAKALQSGNIDLAHFLWAQKNTVTNTKQEIESLLSEKRKLVCELDAVYKSRSWCITKPLRCLVKKFVSGSRTCLNCNNSGKL